MENKGCGHKANVEGILISFCIPVFNNVEANVKLVRELLKNPDKRIQVVVCDNCSNESVTPLKNGINDIRYKYCRNDESVSPMQNWCRALDAGDGEYLYLIMGGNRIISRRISNLLHQVEQLGQMGIKIAIDRTFDFTNLPILGFHEDLNDRKDINVLNFYDSLIRFINLGEHQTGLIVERKAFTSLNNRKGYFESDYIYPDNYIKRDIIENYGFSAIIHSGAYILASTYVNRRAKRSGVEYGRNLNELYFSPRRKLGDFDRAISMIEEIDHTKISRVFRRKYFICKWMELMEHLTWNWKRNIENPTITKHYGVAKKRVTRGEMIKNIIMGVKWIVSNYAFVNRPVGWLTMMLVLLKAALKISEVLFKRC